MWVDSSSSDEVPYRPPSPVQGPLSSPSPSDGSRRLRWGRSNFTQDEIQALETPIEVSPFQHHDYSFPPVFFTNEQPQGNKDQLNSDSESSPFQIKLWFQKLTKVILILLPSLCFAVAAHFINDIFTDFKLFSASFSVFQGVFWPSFVFLVIDLIQRRKSEDTSGTDPTGCANLLCLNGRWKLSLLILLHSTLAAGALIFQLFSIQRLNISVSLALSFSPEVYVILLSYINREKRCSVELILCSVLTYIGFIIIGIPAMTSHHFKNAEDLTTGLVASLVSMGLAIPSSFLLRHIRNSRIPDSLTALSFAFVGSLCTWIVKVIVDSKISLDMNIDPVSIGWAVGLTALVLFGTIFLTMEAKLRSKGSSDNDSPSFTSISKTRAFIFVFSCLWELIRQGIWHTFPEVYDIFGSLIVIVGYFLAVGYEAWSFSESEEVIRSSYPFQFIQWLFTRPNPVAWGSV